MKREALLATIGKDWADWQAVLAHVGEPHMAELGASGDWSVKDIVVHITFFESEMLGLLHARELAGSDLWRLSQDERNRAIFERNQHRVLSDVLAESARVHTQLMSLLDAVTDADLVDASHFKDMPPDWLPWRIVAENTFEHYRDHAAAVRAWLGERGL